MLPYIMAVIVVIAAIYGIGRFTAYRRQLGGRDYMDYFSENEKKG